VPIGWKIVSINNEMVYDDKDISTKLHFVQAVEPRVIITFVSPSTKVPLQPEEVDIYNKQQKQSKMAPQRYSSRLSIGSIESTKHVSRQKAIRPRNADRQGANVQLADMPLSLLTKEFQLTRNRGVNRRDTIKGIERNDSKTLTPTKKTETVEGFIYFSNKSHRTDPQIAIGPRSDGKQSSRLKPLIIARSKLLIT